MGWACICLAGKRGEMGNSSGLSCDVRCPVVPEERDAWLRSSCGSQLFAEATCPLPIPKKIHVP